MKGALQWRSTSSRQTLALGRALGRLLRAGDVLALCGPLGSGKTQLVKGVALGLGVGDDEPVTSPTFMLVREYAGRLTLYHLDAYRLLDARELTSVGLEEMLSDPCGVVVIEWADRVSEAVPEHAWWIDLNHVDEHTREAVLRVPDSDRGAVLVRALASMELGS